MFHGLPQLTQRLAALALVPALALIVAGCDDDDDGPCCRQWSH